MKFPQKNYVIRSLSEDEENRLIAVLSTKEYEYLKGIVIVALNTAFRRQNILDLTWDQSSKKSKTRKERIFNKRREKRAYRTRKRDKIKT